MRLNVLIIPDKFKGTLTSRAAGQAIARGWRRARPRDRLELLPMSDGGDGFGEVLSGLTRARSQHIETLDAAHRPCVAQWWWEAESRTAVIESATVIGLAKLPAKKFHPFDLDTWGLGGLVRAAALKGARRCVVGIGGSATNDGGFGLARALGWQFYDWHGAPIELWTDLGELQRIHAPRRHRWFRELLVAVDVENPLLGARGATRVYGPQKGLRPEDLAAAERCLGRLARVVRRQFGRDFARDAGAGAAGGLGFGLRVFAHGQLTPGFDLFARRAALDEHLGRADLVITGEGAIDASTLMGKGAGRIAERCRGLKLPCIGLAGSLGALSAHRRCFARLHTLTELTTEVQARARAEYWLERLAERVSREWPDRPVTPGR